ncbi:MAG: cysteine--tRNA ligase, partial [Saprospiraceae bacterium]
TLTRLKKEMSDWVIQILGLRDDEPGQGSDKLDGVMQLIIDLRAQARGKKDFAVSDLVRDRLGKLKIQLKDTKDGTQWTNE